MNEMVFAYGSNMCSGRFRDYGLEPIGRGRATSLDGYLLDFSKLSKKDGSGKANVSPCAGHQVCGVLYEIHDAPRGPTGNHPPDSSAAMAYWWL